VVEAVVGKADRAVAADLQGGVTGAVALESGVVAVVGEAIEFNHNALGWPEGVDLEAEDGGVENGCRQVMRSAESHKTILEGRAGCGGRAGFGQQTANRAQRMATRITVADSLQHPHLQQVEPISLLKCLFQAVLLDNFSKIEERAGNSGDGNAVAGGPFARLERGTV
jgi:hypothetical protein